MAWRAHGGTPVFDRSDPPLYFPGQEVPLVATLQRNTLRRAVIALNALYGRRRYDDRESVDRGRPTDSADFCNVIRLIEKIDSEPPRLPDLVDKFADDALELIENQFLWLAYWREEAYRGDLRRDREKAEAAIHRRNAPALLQLLSRDYSCCETRFFMAAPQRTRGGTNGHFVQQSEFLREYSRHSLG